MIHRTVAQKATILMRQEEKKIFSPSCYGIDLVAGDIKKVSACLLSDLDQIEKYHGKNISSRVRQYIIEELQEQLEDLRESKPGVYLKMLPRIHSVESDLREAEQDEYVVI